MAIKLVSLVALMAASALCQQHQSGHQQYQPQVQYQQPQHHYNHEPEPYDDHPKYDFHYKVEDEHTGDYKEQEESRDGDVVKGFYWLIDADGYRRHVEYVVDGKSGFQAKVTREPTGHAPVQPRPQHQAPQHQAPQHQAPQHQAPQYQAPQYQAPQYQAQHRVAAPAPIRAPAPIHPPAHH